MFESTISSEEESLTEEAILRICAKKLKTDVVKLDAFAMDIKSICRLDAFTKLEVVSLSLNSISSLEGFSKCVSLKELYIRKNKIENLSEIRHLCNLPLLNVLFLADNPGCEVPRYRTKVLRVLQGLRKLDSDVVQSTEVEEAIASTDPDVLEFEHEIKPKSANAVPKSSMSTVGDSDSKSSAKTDDSSVSSKRIGQSKTGSDSKSSPTDNKQLPPTAAAADKGDVQSTNVLMAVRFLLKELNEQELRQVQEMCANRLRGDAHI
eukprot:gene7898-16168_t